MCCHGKTDTYVRVTGDDWERLGAEAERVAHFIGNRAFMKMAGGHCAALDVRAAADGSGAAEFFAQCMSDGRRCVAILGGVRRSARES